MDIREDEGFDQMMTDPVVEVEHDDYNGIRYHILTLKSGLKVSVVPLVTLLKTGLVATLRRI